MKKLLLLLIIPFLSFGQGWEQAFGDGQNNTVGYSIQQTNDGGYIISGESGGTYLLKIDEDGQEEWSQNFTNYGRGVAVFEAGDEGYIVGCLSMDLLKIDEDGQEEWSASFEEEDGAEICYAFQTTSDGGCVLFGTTSSMEYGYYLLLVKIDAGGQEEWRRWLDGYYGTSIHQTNDGGYILVNRGGNSELIKTDENGQEEWRKVFEDGDIFSVKQANDGGYVFGVSWYSSNGLSVIKTDESGEAEWISALWTASGMGGEIKEIEQTNDGGYIATGWMWEDSGDSSVYLAKVDGSGEVEWIQTYGEYSILLTNDEGYNIGSTNSYDKGYSVQQANDGGYIICGQTNIQTSSDIYANKEYVYIIKTDSEGNITSTNIIETTTINKNLITTIDILGRETTNKGLQLHIYDDGTVEKKYVIK